jgi:hypothetical protein
MTHCLPLRLRCACLFSVLTLAGPAQAICYSTPRLAVESALVGGALSTVAIKGGYRIVSLQLDPVLRRRWATIANCAHPEWPAVAMPAGDDGVLKGAQQGQPEALQLPTIVHIGDIVRLWRQDSLSRIEVAGVSQGSGTVGTTIRVRLLHTSSEEQPRPLVGVIRGPADVEMKP